MIIDIPFTFSVTYLPKHARINTKIAGFIDTCPVDFVEMDDDRMPVVCRTNNFDADKDAAHLRVEVRKLDDGFWSQPIVGNRHEGFSLLTVDELKRRIADGEGANGAGTFWHTGKRDYAPAGQLPLDVKTIIYDSRSDEEAVIVAAARRFVLVNGMVFTPCREPVLHLEERWMGAYSFLSLTLREMPSEKRILADCRRIDALEELVDHAHRQFEDMSNNLAKTVEELNLEVLRPDLLTFEDRRIFLEAAIEEYLRRAADRLATGTKAFMMAYADLRDLLPHNAPLEELVLLSRHLLCTETTEYRGEKDFMDALNRVDDWLEKDRERSTALSGLPTF